MHPGLKQDNIRAVDSLESFVPEVSHTSIPAVVMLISSSSEEGEKFMRLVEACINQMVTVGAQGVQLVRHAPKQTLTSEQSQNVIWEEPDDEYWELCLYSQKHGDPCSNGLGHTVTERRNRCNVLETCVIVPAPKIYRLKLQRAQMARLSTQLDSADDAKGEGQLKHNCAALASIFGEGLVVGIGFDLA